MSLQLEKLSEQEQTSLSKHRFSNGKTRREMKRSIVHVRNGLYSTRLENSYVNSNLTNSSERRVGAYMFFVFVLFCFVFVLFCFLTG